MKRFKRCDGYVLPYVLVVFLILSAVSVSICGTALNNLRAQEAAAERSKALYEAECEIEKFISAKLMKIPADDGFGSKEAARNYFRDKSKEVANETDDRVALNSAVDGENFFILKVKAESANKEVLIETALNVTPKIESYTVTTTNGDATTTETFYKVTGVETLAYDSYNISYEGGGAE